MNPLRQKSFFTHLKLFQIPELRLPRFTHYATALSNTHTHTHTEDPISDCISDKHILLIILILIHKSQSLPNTKLIDD